MRSVMMLAAVAALTLSGCNAATAPPGSAGSTAPPLTAAAGAAAGVADTIGLPPPASVADRTTIDETAGIAFETAVATAADLATLAVRTKVVPTSRLGELRERVAWARTAVGAVRAAHDTFNAATYRAAVDSAECAIARVRTLANGQADPVCPVASKGGSR